ncbi:PQQ-dependent sugar dehydrogenase [Patescibacteria group bacterium]|nr:PQQ-dependent sugar dehydrogenase [Patescibacteria group bacterium]
MSFQIKFAFVVIVIIVAALIAGFFGIQFLSEEKALTSQSEHPADESASADEDIPFSRFEVEVIAENLEAPWDLDFWEDRIFVTERAGRIRVIENGEFLPDPYFILDVYTGGQETGLLGIALHPDFSRNRFVYIYYTYVGEDGLVWNRVLKLVDRGDYAEISEVILDGIPGTSIHNGGRMKFGPDEKLYITTGDAGREHLVQDLNSLAGKILRINPDGTVPEDNPFPDSPVWSYGHRNPQGLAWSPTGDLWATEHGPDPNDMRGRGPGRDEVNLIKPGANYGWPEVAGKAGEPEYVDPILSSGEKPWAPSGASFWRGELYFTALGFTPGEGRRALHRVTFDSDYRSVKEHDFLLENEFGRLRTAEPGPDGNLYILTSNRDGRGDPATEDDRIIRLKPKNN